MSKFTAATVSATGSDLRITVPSNQKWRIKATEVDINASAVAGSRELSLNAYVNGVQITLVPSSYAQSSGLHIFYAFAPGLPSDGSLVRSDLIRQGFPEILLGPGDYIQTDTLNLDGGDVITMNVNYEADLV